MSLSVPSEKGAFDGKHEKKTFWEEERGSSFRVQSEEGELSKVLKSKRSREL